MSRKRKNNKIEIASRTIVITDFITQFCRWANLPYDKGLDVTFYQESHILFRVCINVIGWIPHYLQFHIANITTPVAEKGNWKIIVDPTHPFFLQFTGFIGGNRIKVPEILSRFHPWTKFKINQNEVSNYQFEKIR